MKLYTQLENQLKREEEFTTKEGKLKKQIIINKAQNYDEKLLELLLESRELKDKFFVKTSVALIFKKEFFIQFLEQKNYLNDSYTKYKNKIGLNIDGKYLKQRNEIALVFPFKDCILEGGQSREEDKREELFFNEILAQDEITQLLEPKILTNAKSYTKEGEHNFEKFTRSKEINKERELPENTITDNLIIKGNNLLVLHSIKKEFAGKIKLIYIDPPYNTGGNANTFTYNNSFNHSTWLTFMQNRLTVARDFLTQDGFIAIAIDHYELGYLITLADEIYGRENRIGIVSVVNNPMGRNQAKYFSTINDFMVIYAKNSDYATFNNVVLKDEFLKTFDKKDEKGKYKLKNFVRIGGGNANLRENKKTFWYPLFVSPDLKEITITEKENYTQVFPITSTNQERTWKLSKKSTELILDDLVASKNKEGTVIISEKYRMEKGQKVPTIWSDKKYNANHNGIRLLEKIIGRKDFSFPKSIYTVLDTIKLMTNKSDIIMDFHAGSGTTAHAVLELNKEDEGNRKFILVKQLDQHAAICIERNQKIVQQTNSKDNFVYLELKKHNQIFADKIRIAEDNQTILSIWEQMKEKSFLNYDINIQRQEQNIKEFEKLELKEQKMFLLEILDKNQLYVNLSSLRDESFKITQQEEKLTKDFYKLS